MKVLNLSGVDLSNDFPRGTPIETDPALGPFNHIITRDFFASADLAECLPKLKAMVENLAEGGQFHLAEPSAEWAAQEIKSARISIPVMMHIYGTRERVRRNICSLEELRDMMLMAGLTPLRAETRAYVIAKDDVGNVFNGDQHYVVGMKPFSGKEAKAWVPD